MTTVLYDDGYSNKGFFLPLNGQGILQRYRICTTVSPSGWPSLRSHQAPATKGAEVMGHFYAAVVSL